MPNFLAFLSAQNKVAINGESVAGMRIANMPSSGWFKYGLNRLHGSEVHRVDENQMVKTVRVVDVPLKQTYIPTSTPALQSLLPQVYSLQTHSIRRATKQGPRQGHASEERLYPQ